MAALGMVGARARDIYDRAAKERQRASGGDRKSGKSVVENLPQPDSGKSRDAVGKAVGVSGKSIDYATKVLNNGTPELVKAVKEKVPVNLPEPNRGNSGKFTGVEQGRLPRCRWPCDRHERAADGRPDRT